MHPQPPANHNQELQREIDTLHQRLRQLHADAEHNQRVLARFQTRELELLGAGQLTELLDRLTRGMRQSFAVDAIRLLLLDPFLVIHELLAGTPDMPEDALRDIELCTDIAATRGRFVDLHAPWLGPWDEHRHHPLFGRRLNGSVALLPLRQAAGLTGFLCLGSRDRNRFQPGQATDFMAHLAGVAAVCLENAVNRERLRVAGITDALTGLYNRRHLQHRLEQEVTRARRYRQPLSCLFVDADHFKRINDTHGHAAGDQVLAALAQKLRTRLRSSDLAARYGGEEFALLLPQTGIRAAHRLARDICAAVAAAPIVLDDGESVALTVSVGVAAISGSGHGSPRDLSQGLLQAADEAVYRAKEAGRNRAMCAAPTAPRNGQGATN
jgi:diguanylate cyclase (GGDEF)-like protein